MGPNVDLHVGGVDEGRERHGSRVGRNSNLNMTMMKSEDEPHQICFLKSFVFASMAIHGIMIPARFLTTMGHFVATIMIFYSTVWLVDISIRATLYLCAVLPLILRDCIYLTPPLHRAPTYSRH